MPWHTSRPNGKQTAAKYRTPEHRATVKRLRAELTTTGTGRCAETICVYHSRLITPGMDLHVCHDRTTGRVLGLGHAACNRAEAARYARTKQTSTRLRW